VAQTGEHVRHGHPKTTVAAVIIGAAALMGAATLVVRRVFS